jgi:hypothetical protein
MDNFFSITGDDVPDWSTTFHQQYDEFKLLVYSMKFYIPVILKQKITIIVIIVTFCFFQICVRL